MIIWIKTHYTFLKNRKCFVDVQNYILKILKCYIINAIRTYLLQISVRDISAFGNMMDIRRFCPLDISIGVQFLYIPEDEGRIQLLMIRFQDLYNNG